MFGTSPSTLRRRDFPIFSRRALLLEVVPDDSCECGGSRYRQ